MTQPPSPSSTGRRLTQAASPNSDNITANLGVSSNENVQVNITVSVPYADRNNASAIAQAAITSGQIRRGLQEAGLLSSMAAILPGGGFLPQAVAFFSKLSLAILHLSPVQSWPHLKQRIVEKLIVYWPWASIRALTTQQAFEITLPGLILISAEEKFCDVQVLQCKMQL